MFPTKSMLEYMTEFSRLFPRNNEDDNHRAQQILNLQRGQLMTPIIPSFANQSSSSADSTSPESYAEIQFRTPETPTAPRRQRPIVGRKIFSSNEPSIYESPRATSSHTNYDSDMEWSPVRQMRPVAEENMYSLTPPTERYNNNTEKYMEQSFRTPLKNQNIPIPHANVSPTSSYSPSSHQLSPNAVTFSPNTAYLQNYPQSNMALGATYNNFNFDRQTQNRFTLPIGLYQSGNRQVEAPTAGKMCTFCRKNGETPAVYLGHMLKERVGNRNVVTCPILRMHTCATCGASGDNAHTKTYCPVHRSSNNGVPLQSTTIILKNTRIKSNGKRRY